jgi:hypothetical protein
MWRLLLSHSWVAHPGFLLLRLMLREVISTPHTLLLLLLVVMVAAVLLLHTLLLLLLLLLLKLRHPGIPHPGVLLGSFIYIFLQACCCLLLFMLLLLLMPVGPPLTM